MPYFSVIVPVYNRIDEVRGNMTTLPITLDQMIYHGKSVVKGVNTELFLKSDS